jgi:RNA polymerase sigma-70 factor (ECF subfamily)
VSLALPSLEASALSGWAVVLSARSVDDPRADEALCQLCQNYWPAPYVFLRRQGLAPHDAGDWLRDFLDRLLARADGPEVEPEAGRFRVFLLGALRRALANAQRNPHSTPRSFGASRLTLNEPAQLERCEVTLREAVSADLAFDRVWAGLVMERAARRLRAEYVQSGHATLFETIRRRLACEPTPTLVAQAASDLGLTDIGLRAAVFRLRQRFRRLVRDELARTVQSAAHVQGEAQHLLRSLSAD